MSYPDDPYLRHQRQRWLRHDAHLWIRPDAARWVKPGYDPGEIYPTLKRKPDAVKAAALEAELAAEDAAFAAKIAASRRVLAALRVEVDELKAALARRRLEETKYSPTQPRVPAGNPDGGQWTGGGGASRRQSLAGDASRKPGVTDPRVISDADPEAVRAGDRYVQAGNRRSGLTVRINGQTYELTPGQAARLEVARARAEDATARVRKLDPEWKPSPSFYQSPEGLIRTYEASAAEAQARVNELTGGARPVDLLRQRELGGHAIEGHVNRSNEAIAVRARDLAISAAREGREEPSRVGSFSSLEAANKLVNSTLARNQDKIDLVTSGRSPRETLKAEYPTVTGKEAYVRNATSQAVIRETYGVVVVIVPEGRVPSGYRIETAFPANFGR